MKRYGTLILALALVVALAGLAAAQQAGDMSGQGGMQQPNAGAQMAAPSGRGGVAPGVSCDKSCIMDVQNKLKESGCYHGKADGTPGPKTEAALKRFQSINKIPATGQIDQQTMSLLEVSPSSAGMGGGAPSAAPPSGGASSPQGGGM